jgi:hypothetical protein
LGLKGKTLFREPKNLFENEIMNWQFGSQIPKRSSTSDLIGLVYWFCEFREKYLELNRFQLPSYLSFGTIITAIQGPEDGRAGVAVNFAHSITTILSSYLLWRQ